MEPNHFYPLKCRNLQFVVNSLEAIRAIVKELRDAEVVMPGKDMDFVRKLDLESSNLEELQKYFKDELWAVYPLLPPDEDYE